LRGKPQSKEAVLRRLKSLSDAKTAKGMARFGINTKKALGISTPQLRTLAREIGKNHVLAQEVWDSQFHEARILASMIDDPKMVTDAQMEAWARDFDSWDVCDQCCGNLFDKTEFAHRKAVEWSRREEEFVKRAGFALMAWLAFHDKKAGDEDFVEFLALIEIESTDDRKYVKKAVNWALRQIGKRNRKFNKAAIMTAKRISQADSKAAKWIASDALRELTSESVQDKLNQRIAVGETSLVVGSCFTFSKIFAGQPL
jgi:3-methyladenine DNA glycosylase AlkD